MILHNALIIVRKRKFVNSVNFSFISYMKATENASYLLITVLCIFMHHCIMCSGTFSVPFLWSCACFDLDVFVYACEHKSVLTEFNYACYCSRSDIGIRFLSVH